MYWTKAVYWQEVLAQAMEVACLMQRQQGQFMPTFHFSIKQFQFGDKMVAVTVDSDLLILSGQRPWCPGACTTGMEGGGAAAWVTVNEKFLAVMTEEEQRAVCAHELAHKELGHLKDKLGLLAANLLGIRRLQMEGAADKYAVQVLGASAAALASALKKIQRCQAEKFGEAADSTCKKRIAALESM